MRCMSGVTTIQRSARSSRSGSARFAWVNIAKPLSTISNASTAPAPRGVYLVAFS